MFLPRKFLILATASVIGLPQAATSQDSANVITATMLPTARDHTAMWWRDGFPQTVEGAPWHRCVKTGRYAFILDTNGLTIPHFGPHEAGPLGALPPAELSLSLTVDGTTYRCRGSEEASRFKGPRLIASGRFLQRADVTNLVFTADDGSRLNGEARFETLAWPDRLGMILAARPGHLPIPEGELSFGRVRGGFGLTGGNRFDLSAEEAPIGEAFTLSFWVFVPRDFRAGKHSPWLLCRKAHEQADGNFGIMLDADALPQLRFNFGGGRENALVFRAERRHRLNVDQWNHVAVSYDGETARLFVNGHFAVEEAIGKPFDSPPGNLTIGDRGDGLGDGAFRFRGVLDEVLLYDRGLTLAELRRLRNAPETIPAQWPPARQWRFREDGTTSLERPREAWQSASIEVRLAREGATDLVSRWNLPEGGPWAGPDWNEASLMVDPVDFRELTEPEAVTVAAVEHATGTSRPVVFEPSLGWHRINLDGIEPIPPAGQENPTNDAIERVRLRLANPSAGEREVRLMFEKTAQGFRQRIGTPITGVSAVLRDADGDPTGIPVQLSKNWHWHAEGGVHQGQWFHGISLLRLPPGEELELELVMIYGHWGGVAAASHAQLSLIGWGGNQLWDQSALGSWGESICFNPEQTQAACTVTDVRPLMVSSMGTAQSWGWTHNHGGGDWFRFFDSAGERRPHARMRTRYHRQGPCLTEVTYHGQVHGTGIQHEATVSLGRTDDLLRGTYRIRMRVTEPVDFSRLVLFQIGADTYCSTREKKFAVGSSAGLIREWETQWGGDAYRGEAIEVTELPAWASLHEWAGGDKEDDAGARASRGLVVREWKARLGGKEAPLRLQERGVDLAGNRASSTLDLVPPAGLTRLEPGDFVEATIEHLLVPRFADDYYGPDEALRAALEKDGNTWRVIRREAVRGDRRLAIETGQLLRLYPDVRVAASQGIAEFDLEGGIGHVPITIVGLESHEGFQLTVDGVPLDHGVHGKDYWQTDFDSTTRTWSRTYNLPRPDDQPVRIRFAPASPSP